MTKAKPEGRFKKPCPDLMKGQRCPLCGGTYLCLQSQRKKISQPKPKKAK